MARQRDVRGFRGRRRGEDCVVMIQMSIQVLVLSFTESTNPDSVCPPCWVQHEVTKARSLPSGTQSGRRKRDGNQQYNSIGSEPCHRLLWGTSTHPWEREGMLPRGCDVYAGVSKHEEQFPWGRATQAEHMSKGMQVGKIKVCPRKGRWFSAYSLRCMVALVGAAEKRCRRGGWGP